MSRTQDFVDYVAKYNQDLAGTTEAFFQREKLEASLIDSSLEHIIDDYKDFLNGGKKLRGVLIKFCYEIYGGRDASLALSTSLIIEIIHSFFLIHDDIMDQDEVRRNSPTMHVKYSREFGNHFGIAKAIDQGDVGMFLAYKALFGLDIPFAVKDRLGRILNQILLEVGYGQMLDVTYEQQEKFTEEDVLRVHRYKTAEYTISGPLSIGAILAGAPKSKLKALKDFGIPVGIAFQIKDDELGMFSTEEELGKPVDSDLKEGKVTLLIVKALEKAKGADRKFLRHAHGNDKLTLKEVERVRDIMKKCGALGYSQRKSRELVEEGKKFIPQITRDPKYQKLLSQLADFVIERKS
ncbi:hypothetical protein CMO96_00685 [Candidatus Woesebacteria bacterium]|nr:hypothetical protein [Candidatus Woesebacteria bacterium]